jgi:hypothetical protein
MSEVQLPIKFEAAGVSLRKMEILLKFIKGETQAQTLLTLTLDLAT